MYKIILKYKDGNAGERMVAHAELPVVLQEMLDRDRFQPELDYFRIETVEKEN